MSSEVVGCSAAPRACVYGLVEDLLLDETYCYAIRESRVFEKLGIFRREGKLGIFTIFNLSHR